MFKWRTHFFNSFFLLCCCCAMLCLLFHFFVTKNFHECVLQSVSVRQNHCLVQVPHYNLILLVWSAPLAVTDPLLNCERANELKVSIFVLVSRKTSRHTHKKTRTNEWNGFKRWVQHQQMRERAVRSKMLCCVSLHALHICTTKKLQLRVLDMQTEFWYITDFRYFNMISTDIYVYVFMSCVSASWNKYNKKRQAIVGKLSEHDLLNACERESAILAHPFWMQNEIVIDCDGRCVNRLANSILYLSYFWLCQLNKIWELTWSQFIFCHVWKYLIQFLRKKNRKKLRNFH